MVGAELVPIAVRVVVSEQCVVLAAGGPCVSCNVAWRAGMHGRR